MKRLAVMIAAALILLSVSAASVSAVSDEEGTWQDNAYPYTDDNDPYGYGNEYNNYDEYNNYNEYGDGYGNYNGYGTDESSVQEYSTYEDSYTESSAESTAAEESSGQSSEESSQQESSSAESSQESSQTSKASPQESSAQESSEASRTADTLAAKKIDVDKVNLHTYHISDVEMYIDLPADMLVITPGIKADDPALKASNMTVDQAKKMLTDSDSVIKAFSKDFSYDITVTMVKNKNTQNIGNLSGLEDSQIQKIVDNLMRNGYAKGFSRNRYNNVLFITMNMEYTDDAGRNVYGIQQYTVVNGANIIVTLQVKDTPLTNDLRALFSKIMTSVFFEADNLNSAAEEKTDISNTSIGELDRRYLLIIAGSIIAAAALAGIIIVGIKRKETVAAERGISYERLSRRDDDDDDFDEYDDDDDDQEDDDQDDDDSNGGAAAPVKENNAVFSSREKEAEVKAAPASAGKITPAAELSIPKNPYTPVGKAEAVAQPALSVTSEIAKFSQINELAKKAAEDKARKQQEDAVVFAESTPKAKTAITQIGESVLDRQPQQPSAPPVQAPASPAAPPVQAPAPPAVPQQSVMQQPKEETAARPAQQTRPVSEYERRFGKNRGQFNNLSQELPKRPEGRTISETGKKELSNFEKRFGKVQPAAAAATASTAASAEVKPVGELNIAPMITARNLRPENDPANMKGPSPEEYDHKNLAYLDDGVPQTEVSLDIQPPDTHFIPRLDENEREDPAQGGFDISSFTSSLSVSEPDEPAERPYDDIYSSSADDVYVPENPETEAESDSEMSGYEDIFSGSTGLQADEETPDAYMHDASQDDTSGYETNDQTAASDEVTEQTFAQEPAAPIEYEQPEEPAAPIEYEQPEEPAAPIEYEQPEEPAAPIEYEQPEEPAAPIEYEQPEEPAAPIEHEQSEVSISEKDVQGEALTEDQQKRLEEHLNMPDEAEELTEHVARSKKEDFLKPPKSRPEENKEPVQPVDEQPPVLPDENQTADENPTFLQKLKNKIFDAGETDSIYETELPEPDKNKPSTMKFLDRLKSKLRHNPGGNENGESREMNEFFSDVSAPADQPEPVLKTEPVIEPEQPVQPEKVEEVPPAPQEILPQATPTAETRSFGISRNEDGKIVIDALVSADGKAQPVAIKDGNAELKAKEERIAANIAALDDVATNARDSSGAILFERHAEVIYEKPETVPAPAEPEQPAETAAEETSAAAVAAVSTDENASVPEKQPSKKNKKSRKKKKKNKQQQSASQPAIAGAAVDAAAAAMESAASAAAGAEPSVPAVLKTEDPSAEKDVPKPEVKQESKPEVKEESMPEVKEESKPEVKEESMPEVKEESKPEVEEKPAEPLKQPEIKEQPKPQPEKPKQPEKPAFNFRRDSGIRFEYPNKNRIQPVVPRTNSMTFIPRLENVNAEEYNRMMDQIHAGKAEIAMAGGQHEPELIQPVETMVRPSVQPAAPVMQPEPVQPQPVPQPVQPRPQPPQPKPEPQKSPLKPMTEVLRAPFEKRKAKQSSEIAFYSENGEDDTLDPFAPGSGEIPLKALEEKPNISTKLKKSIGKLFSAAEDEE